jgi:SAM-dependent methyltransferase
MSEFLARSGYWVTGVDVSDDMVDIARLRISRIPEQVGDGVDPLAEFHAMPVREMPWTDRFDAAVLYDTMHHFDNELETLKVILRTLVPGGTIYIREGARPPAGSEGEQALIEEMRTRKTLESPFDPGYLLEVVGEAGFEDVKQLIEVDELVGVGDLKHPIDALTRLVRYRAGRGDINTLVARKPLGTEIRSDADNFSARVEALGPWEDSSDPREQLLWIEVTNEGRAFWPVARGFPYPLGAVTVGPFRQGDAGERIELDRVMLPHSVSPRETVRVLIRAPREVASEEIRVDLVREGLAWFSELGSRPLVVPPKG